MDKRDGKTVDLEAVLSKKERELNELYCEMGKSLLELAENEQRVANRLVDEIIALRKKLVRAHNSVQCPECLAFNAAGSNYCSRCGSRFENGEADDVLCGLPDDDEEEAL